MKFIRVYFALIFLFSTYILSAKVKNTQLFQAVEKSLSDQNTPSESSVFGKSEPNEQV